MRTIILLFNLFFVLSAPAQQATICRDHLIDANSFEFKKYHKILITSEIFRKYVDQNSHGKFAGFGPWFHLCNSDMKQTESIQMSLGHGPPGSPSWDYEYCQVTFLLAAQRIVSFQEGRCWTPMD